MGTDLALEGGEIRFARADERGEGVAAVGIAAVDRDRAFAAARARGLRVEANGMTIGGVRFELGT